MTNREAHGWISYTVALIIAGLGVGGYLRGDLALKEAMEWVLAAGAVVGLRRGIARTAKVVVEEVEEAESDAEDDLEPGVPAGDLNRPALFWPGAEGGPPPRSPYRPGSEIDEP